MHSQEYITREVNDVYTKICDLSVSCGCVIFGGDWDTCKPKHLDTELRSFWGMCYFVVYWIATASS